jgi:hypothetical protein
MRQGPGPWLHAGMAARTDGGRQSPTGAIGWPGPVAPGRGLGWAGDLRPPPPVEKVLPGGSVR